MSRTTGVKLSDKAVKALDPPEKGSRIRYRVRRGPRQMHAERTLAKLFERHGDGHLRDVLTSILESEGSAYALTAPIMSATSELRSHQEWWHRDANTWLAVFDDIDLAQLADRAREHCRTASRAYALRLFLRLPLPDQQENTPWTGSR